MSVILKQFDGGAIAPRDDAILYNSIITRNGILNGCTITHLGANQIKITAGRGIIKGRMFEVEEMTVNCQLASAGTQKGRMYLRMELSNMENPAQIKTVAADTLPELVQEEDCNYTNGIYELELCTYDVTDTLLSNLKTTYEVIDTVFPVAKTLDDVNGVTDEDVLAGALAVKELSSELYQETTETNSMNLVDAVNFICNNLELQKSFRKVFQCLNGWYSLDTIKSSGGVCSGFLSSLTTSEAYSFYKGGADAVLKKLGNATITFTTELHGSGWAATRIVKPDGYSKVDVNLSRGSGSVYGYKPDDSGTPYGTVLGTLTTAVQTFDVSEYTEIGIRVDGNNSNAKTVFY